MAQTDHSDVRRVVHDLFSKIPFNQLLGLKIDELSDDHARLSFRMRDDLVGNYTRNILHGGVISATLDVTAGLMAFLGVAKRIRSGSLEEKIVYDAVNVAVIRLRHRYRPCRKRITATFTASYTIFSPRFHSISYSAWKSTS